jgi:hypothetical protein
MGNIFSCEIKNTNGNNLAFINSLNVNVYPSGRRNSMLGLETQKNGMSVERYYPFDPEARLNTEHNNMNKSGLNGFTQTYIKSWNRKALHLVVGGYSFKIDLTPHHGEGEIKNFVADFASKLDASGIFKNASNGGLDSTKFADSKTPAQIYANIRLEETPIYSELGASDKLNYSTWILRSQSYRVIDTYGPGLDLLKGITNNAEVDANSNAVPTTHKRLGEPGSYYFSGLSFSVVPSTGPFEPYLSVLKNKEKIPTYVEKFFTGDGTSYAQKVISICIAHKDKSTDFQWEVYQPALLPNIRHGLLENQVEVDHLLVEGNTTVEGNLTTYTLRVLDDATIKGDLIANNKEKGALAVFYDAQVGRYLVVKNTLDTENLVVNNAQVNGDITRNHDGTLMGLVTMKVDEGVERPEVYDKNVSHTLPRLKFFTKNKV